MHLWVKESRAGVQLRVVAQQLQVACSAGISIKRRQAFRVVGKRHFFLLSANKVEWVIQTRAMCMEHAGTFMKSTNTRQSQQRRGGLCAHGARAHSAAA